MSSASNIPGVYREEIVLRPDPKLTTGTPGFVGITAPAGAAAAVSPVALTRQDEFAAKVKGAAGGYLADAVAGFFQNGGRRCYVATASVRVAQSTDSEAQKDEAQK